MLLLFIAMAYVLIGVRIHGTIMDLIQKGKTRYEEHMRMKEELIELQQYGKAIDFQRQYEIDTSEEEKDDVEYALFMEKNFGPRSFVKIVMSLVVIVFWLPIFLVTVMSILIKKKSKQ